MLKTISAALLAVTVLVAPAFAASPAAKTTHPPVTKSVQLKPSVLNANARMGHHHHGYHRHYHRHYHHYRHYRHHRFH